MNQPAPEAIAVRPATPIDADGITAVFLESAVYHAGLDPERYAVPAAEPIVARYREGVRSRSFRSVLERKDRDLTPSSVTLVAETNGEIVGFVDVRLERSPDPMHRDFTYCHIVEIAVASRHQSRGIGAALLRAAEAWGLQRGAEFASLEFLSANTRAAAFYQERMGYRVAAMIAIKRLRDRD